MAITKMSKFSLACLRKDKKRLLQQIQHFGNIQFIKLKTEFEKEEFTGINDFIGENFSDELQDVDCKLNVLKSTIKYLETQIQCGNSESGLKALKKGKEEVFYSDLVKVVSESGWEEYCSDIKKCEEEISELSIELDKISEDVEILTPWKPLDCALNSIKDTENIKVLMGTVPKESVGLFEKEIEEFSLTQYRNVNMDASLSYYVLFIHNSELNDVKEIMNKYDFAEVKVSYKIEVPKQIELLLEKSNYVAEKIDAIKLKIKSEHKLEDLKMCEEYYLAVRDRLQVNENFFASENTVILHGWVPEELQKDFNNIVEDVCKGVCSLKFTEVGEDEDLEVPVKLKNNGFVKPFESITEMYSLPNYKGLDPTPLLAPFYMVFFGMMIGDFGYGLLITVATVMALKLFNLEEGTKNFAKLFMYLGISTTVWGLIYGAGFGDFIEFNSVLNMNNDVMTIMAISIGFGVIQILVALGIKSYMFIRDKQYFAAFADVGLWLITFAGIAMFALKVPFGMWIMIAGMVGIVLTNGRDAGNTAGKLASGAYALYGITNYVADLVSYTRLMALGVAGGSIATAMNLIIGYLPNNIIVTVVITPLLFIAVHIFNLLLGALGAYVHSCRLQYVEYFGKFYDGGGKPFLPLKTKDKNYKIKYLFNNEAK